MAALDVKTQEQRIVACDGHDGRDGRALAATIYSTLASGLPSMRARPGA